MSGFYWKCITLNPTGQGASTDAALMACGIIPEFIEANDKRPFKEQLDENYVAHVSWEPMGGPATFKDGVYSYEGDSPLEPFARIGSQNPAHEGQELWIYRYGIVVLETPTETLWGRMD